MLFLLSSTNFFITFFHFRLRPPSLFTLVNSLWSGADPHWCHQGSRTPIFKKKIVDSVY
ncbi:hypothetical protein HanIR_Chr11g0506321 [Helianthus annuus]|nr:hypothetical protein HanIR_Chr11g0506321 [Helianthus annuus]